MPPLAFILARMPAAIASETQALLSRGDKPPGWEPISREEFEELKRRVRDVANMKGLR